MSNAEILPDYQPSAPERDELAQVIPFPTFDKEIDEANATALQAARMRVDLIDPDPKFLPVPPEVKPVDPSLIVRESGVTIARNPGKTALPGNWQNHLNN